MSEHTPGPWRQTRSVIYSPGQGIICALAQVHTPTTMLEFIPLDIGSEDWDEGMANGNLIEAAPDLLAALEPFAYLAEVMGEGQVLTFRGVYVTWEQVEAARIAIAKAKGESDD